MKASELFKKFEAAREEYLVKRFTDKNFQTLYSIQQKAWKSYIEAVEAENKKP